MNDFDYTRNFKWSPEQRRQCLMYNGTLDTLIWEINVKDTVVVWIHKSLILQRSFRAENAQVTFAEKLELKLKVTKTWISYSHLFRQSLYWYRCKSDSVIFVESCGSFKITHSVPFSVTCFYIKYHIIYPNWCFGIMAFFAISNDKLTMEQWNADLSVMKSFRIEKKISNTRMFFTFR